jgi:predicted PurR-regulated permease PerM
MSALVSSERTPEPPPTSPSGARPEVEPTPVPPTSIPPTSVPPTSLTPPPFSATATPTPLVGVRSQRIALIGVVVVATLAAAYVASGLWSGLLLGLLAAFTVEPANRRILARWPKRRALAAGLSIAIIGLLGAGLIAAVSAIMVNEIIEASQAVQDFLRRTSLEDLLGGRAQRSLEAVGITPATVADRIGGLAERAAAIASRLVSSLLGSTFTIVGSGIIAFVTAYYMLKDGRPIEHRLERLLPLNPRTTRELVDEFRKVGRGTLVGSFLTGLIQGALGAVGYAIYGVPRAFLLGVITGFASFIPVFGTMLVWIPVGVGLIVTGRPGAGIFELAWGVLITTTLVDYVLRPVLVGRGSRSHPLLLLIGVIGGVEVFGGMGALAGPIVMAFFASVLRIYRRDIVEAIHDEAP